jgi:PAS domain S-box-containing protein
MNPPSSDALAARYRALFEATPDGIMIVDDAGVYVDLNDAMCRMLGGTREELLGRHFADFIPPDRLDDATRAFADLQTAGGLAVEFPVRRLDGTVVNLEWRSRAHFLPGLHFCIAHDLTEREAAQRALRESDERYRAFMTNSSEAIWRFELDEPIPIDLPVARQIDLCYEYGYLAECNDAMARMYGFESTADIVGARLGDLLVREKQENVDYLRAFMEAGYRLTGAESHEVDRDGNEKVFVNSLVGIVENGRILRAWGTQRDATEEKRLERERMALVARLELLADVTGVLGSSLDYEQTLRSIADAAVPRFADWCFIDVVNESGDVERLAVPADLPTGPPSSTLAAPLTARGRVLGQLSFALIGPGRQFSAEDAQLAEDLGRRAGLAIDNARLYSELERANRAKDEFLAMLSHELRTPMTATLGWAGLLERGPVPEDVVAAAAQAIGQSTRAQARLIDDLLDVSRIVSGKMQLSLKPLMVADTIAAAVETVRSAAEAKQIRLDVRLVDRDARLQGDHDRLQQVFWNLLSNAVKFTPRGGWIDVELVTEQENVRVTVRDSGEGIRRDLLPHIFERFRQGDSGASRKHSGLGLGLSIARNLVELHGGTLTAASEGEGRGAAFTVLLPATPVLSGATGS